MLLHNLKTKLNNSISKVGGKSARSFIFLLLVCKTLINYVNRDIFQLSYKTFIQNNYG